MTLQKEDWTVAMSRHSVDILNCIHDHDITRQSLIEVVFSLGLVEEVGLVRALLKTQQSSSK
jgi:hypothetical protein